jgi:hypothetical protein
MSDDDDTPKLNVVEGNFGQELKKKAEANEIPLASDLFQLLSDEYCDNDEGVETAVLIYQEGQALILTGNVSLDGCASLLMMGQMALVEQIYGGADDDDTVH